MVRLSLFGRRPNHAVFLFADDSGQHRGTRRIAGGRASVRTTLYMATLSASKCNPLIHHYKLKLLQRGKAFKVAMTACMRKLLTLLNTLG